MKRIYLLFCSLVPAILYAQVTMNLQLPPAGLTLKNQLWNMLLMNSSGGSLLVHAELRLTEEGSASQVMNATTATITLAPGNQLLQANAWSPIQYNITDPAYQGFGMSDFLPVGRFLACFSIIKHTGDRLERIVEECEMIAIDPLAPPQLIFPVDQSAIETPLPLFNWLPPSPVHLFTNMSYDLNVVEVYEQQTAADAIQQNIPVFNQSGIAGMSYAYPAGATPLETGKKYAWRIVVKNNEAIVATTDTWWFTLQKDAAANSDSKSMMPFAKLKKDNGFNYTIARDELKFEYLNEAGDRAWQVTIQDITAAQSRIVALPLDSIPLKRGQNLVRVPLQKLPGFTDKHIYLLELRNTRNETWRLKFEYRKSDTE